MSGYRCRFVVLLCAALFLGGCAMGGASGKNTVSGLEALKQGNYTEAVGLFETALEEKEQPVLAYRGLGLAYMGLAQYENAEEAFHEALESTDGKMPKTVLDLKKYMAAVEYHLEDYEAVVSICDEILLSGEKGTGDIYFLRGASQLKQGMEEEARSDFDMAVSLDAENYDLYMNIYECYDSCNRSGLGYAYLQAALNIHGEDQEDAYQRGRIYYFLGDYETARTTLLEPVENKYEPAMFLMGDVYLATGESARAKSTYQLIQATFGDSAHCFNGLAMCAIAEEKWDEALSLISQGMALEDTGYQQELCYNEIAAYEGKQDYATALAKAQEYTAKYASDPRGRKELEFLSTR